MLSSFFAPFMASSINVALPSIADEFEMDAVLLTWVATSYLLSAAVFMVPFGKLADIHGRKRVFILGMWVVGIASVLCAIAPSSWILIGARIFQGLGSAMVFGTSIALLTSVYPPQERGKVLGLTVAVTYVGLSVGPSFGGFLTGILGWRSIFVFILPFAATVIIVASRRLKGEWADAKGEAFDFGGSVIYALSLTGVILGFSFLPDLLGVTISLAGVAGMGVFVYWESRFQNPVLDMALFRRNKAFAFSNMAALINYSATFAVTFLMSLYLQYVKELTPEEAGLILVAQPVVMAAFSPLAGRLSDIVEPQIISSIGMAISAVGLVLLSFTAEETSLWVIIASLAVLGFGFALFSSPNMNAIMSSVEKKSYGVASSTVGTMRLVGQVLSLGIATLFISLYIGSTDLTHELAPEFLKSFRLSFTIFAAMCFVGVFASLARGKVRRDSPNGL
ncbi:MAG: MFS transporter [Candidatus Thermoplasmatota archaeon]|nr:MFS transporter [Candidatus Thermoplasmatota archaeon]MBU1915275.1 MFS transporter [Candidatus Thermoplasmatota archaeon]